MKIGDKVKCNIHGFIFGEIVEVISSWGTFYKVKWNFEKYWEINSLSPFFSERKNQISIEKIFDEHYFLQSDLISDKESVRIYSDIDPYGEEDWGDV